VKLSSRWMKHACLSYWGGAKYLSPTSWLSRKYIVYSWQLSRPQDGIKSIKNSLKYYVSIYEMILSFPKYSFCVRRFAFRHSSSQCRSVPDLLRMNSKQPIDIDYIAQDLMGSYSLETCWHKHISCNKHKAYCAQQQHMLHKNRKSMLLSKINFIVLVHYY
jgi:hypothetical protein